MGLPKINFQNTVQLIKNPEGHRHSHPRVQWITDTAVQDSRESQTQLSNRIQRITDTVVYRIQRITGTDIQEF